VAHLRPSLEHLDQLVDPLTTAALTVANALTALDDEWTVYIRPRIGHDVPDFVAVHDLAGVCAIKVKDWKPGQHQRTRNGTIEIVAAEGTQRRACGQPRYQASRCRATIYDEYFALPSDGAETTEAVRAVVILPNFSDAQVLNLLADPAAPSSERKIAAVGIESLQHIEQLVRGVGCAHPHADSIRRIREHLVVSEAKVGAPAAKLNDAVQIIERNPTNDQIRRVRGPAGSGKSLGLAARAARLASEGKTVLVLSFSVTFANRLRELVDEHCGAYNANPTLVTSSNFHSFCERTVEDAEQLGIETLAPRGAEWTRAIVARAKQAFEKGFEDRFDAVLVDEGQDFTLDWWNLLHNSVVVPQGEMLLVVDPTQDLYEKKAWTDDGLMLDAGFYSPWIELTGSYRMPRDLMDLANKFAIAHLDGACLSAEVLDDHTEIAGEQSGSVRRWTNIDHVGDVGREVGREVVRLLQENPGLAPGDVAFLVEYHHDGVAAVHEIEAAGYPVHHIFSRNPDDPRRICKYRFWLNSGLVKGCTVHNFKGWELPALVMGIGVEARSKRVAYVAMTRLKARSGGQTSFLSVINADKVINNFKVAFEAGSAVPAVYSDAPEPAPPVAQLPPLSAPAPSPQPAQFLPAPALVTAGLAPPTPVSASTAALVAAVRTVTTAPVAAPEPLPSPSSTMWTAPAASCRLG
jgi:hypothetical protein